MFRVFCKAIIFLDIVIFKIIIGDQESLSYANCQLTNTCFGRTTDDLANGRSTTSKITEKETTSNTQNTFTNSEDTIATNTQVSLHTTEATSSSNTSPDGVTTSCTTTPISRAKQLQKLTKRKSQTTNELAEESPVAMTTTTDLKSTYDSKSSEAYNINSVWKFKIPMCYALSVAKVNDFIYVLCCDPHPFLTIRVYDVTIPHDLLMMTVVDEMTLMDNFTYPVIMVGIENTNTVYIGDWKGKCIWKIDTDRNEVSKWLSELGDEFSLSVTNDNHLLVSKVTEDLLHLEIYDQDAKLVRSVLFPIGIKGPLRAIQKSNGEFIVSHKSKENYEMCVSFLSTDGQIISQFSLRETVGFKDAQLIYAGNNSELFAAERLGENVYTFDWSTKNWNLTDLSVIISNGSDEMSRKIIGFRSTDGHIFGQIKKARLFMVDQLFWDSDNKNLIVGDYIFGNFYIFDIKTLKWSQVGKISLLCNDLHYDTKRKLFISLCDYHNVEIWALDKY